MFAGEGMGFSPRALPSCFLTRHRCRQVLCSSCSHTCKFRSRLRHDSNCSNTNVQLLKRQKPRSSNMWIVVSVNAFRRIQPRVTCRHIIRPRALFRNCSEGDRATTCPCSEKKKTHLKKAKRLQPSTLFLNYGRAFAREIELASVREVGTHRCGHLLEGSRFNRVL